MVASDTTSLSLKVIVTFCLLLLGAFALSSPHFFKVLRHNRKQLPRGLKVRHDPKNARFEIVAVHGLGADPEYTWTCSAESSGSGGNSRVSLLDLLAQQFPDARILSFAHASDWLLGASISTAQESGVMLSRQLVSHREKNPSHLPIVFIGHSFGGIVIKQALDSLTTGEPWEFGQERHATDFIRDIRGILFLGTPHRGSSLSNLAYSLAQATQLLGSETGLLLLLLQDSSQLSDIADKFEKARKKLTDAKIYSFYEQKKTYFGPFSLGIIVNRESARGLSDHLIAVDTDHSGLNKCSGLSDPVFLAIKDAVERIITTVPPSLSEADKYILDRYANDNALQIQRISDQQLPMDSCYINLSIVQQNFQGGQQVDTVHPPLSNVSIMERSRTKDWEAGEQIDLTGIFEPRTIRDEKEKRRPRRILIRGRPGVGKSTLCKKIIHDFVRLKRNEGCMVERNDEPQNVRDYTYCSHFERIRWIPLRNLAARQDKSYWKELLGVQGSPDYEPMIKALNVHIPRSNLDDTLFLLDGMDEIAARLRDVSALKELVDWFLDQRNVIVTSRPSVRFDRSQKRETFDLELETIGFYQDQVKAYVRMVEEESKAADIIEFLENRPLIQDLVRIPVQLDALCYAWKNRNPLDRNGQFAPRTMTDLYQEIERALWRKDAIKSGRMHQKSTPLPANIERTMDNEIILLERLAFDGLRNNLTVFDTHFLNTWSSQLPEQLIPKDQGLDDTFQSLSFLRPPDITQYERKRNYYFLHLTHQEYFAAQHLKRKWIKHNEESKEVISFFQSHKYFEQFDVVWRFLCGLLDSHDKTSHSQPSQGSHLERYFDLIQAEPLDMLGPAHQRLVMPCLREVSTSQHLSKRDTLENQLECWLLSESRLVGPHQDQQHVRSLADEAECSESLIEKVLPNADNTCKARLLRSLKHRRITNERIMGLVTTWIRDGDEDLIEASLALLGTYPEPWITEDGVQLIVEKLGNGNNDIVSNATKVIKNLMKNPELSKFAVRAILQGLNSSPGIEFQSNAMKIIMKAALRIHDTQRADYGGPTDWILERGFERFGVVSCTCKKSPGLHAHLTDLVMQLLKSSNQQERHDAKRFLENRKALPETVAIKLTRELMISSATVQEYMEKGQKDQKFAFAILKNKNHLQEAVLGELVQLVRNGVKSAKKYASTILENQLDLPRTILDSLAQSFEDGDCHSREAIGAICSKRSNLSSTVFRCLLDNLQHTDNSTQLAALKTLPLSQNLPKEVLAQVYGMLADPDSQISKAAFGVLQEKRDLPKFVLDQINAMLGDENEDIRKRALEFFECQGTTHLSSGQIETMLKSQYQDVRKFGLDFIPFSRDCQHISLCQIDRLADDENESIRNLALQTLARYSDTSKWFDRIEKMLRDGNPNIRRHALKISEYKKLSPLALDLIAQMIDDGCDESIGLILGYNSGRLPAPALRTIVGKLKDKNPRTRIAAFKVAERLSPLPPAVLQLVVVNLEDGDSAVRVAALKCLRSVSPLPQVVINIIEQRLEDTDKYVRSAARDLFNERPNLLQGNPVVLMKILQGGDDRAQRAALGSYLRHFNPQESLLPSILQMLKSMVGGAQICAQSLRLGDFYGSHSRHSGPKLPGQIVPNTGLLELIAQSIGENETAKYFLQSVHQGIQLPDTVSSILLQKLNDDVAEVRMSALAIVEEIGDWSEAKVDAMAEGLVHAELRNNILKILISQSNLSTRALSNIAALFKESSVSGRSHESYSSRLLRIIHKHPGLATICASQGVFLGFYRFLLEQSFDGHLVWLHQFHESSHSGGQSRWCFRTMGEDVGNELVEARRNILGQELAPEGGS